MTQKQPTSHKKISSVDAILPIKTEFVELIDSGKKNHEYRKYLMDGIQRIWLYEIAPVSAITYIMETGPAKVPGQV
jgi:hypothetical protein